MAPESIAHEAAIDSEPIQARGIILFSAVKKFLSSRLIMNSRWLWNSHQRWSFMRAKASRDILKFRVSEMVFPVVFKRYFPPRMPCWFIRIHARLGTMPSKCPRRSTSHGLNMHSMSFKTGKRMLLISFDGAYFLLPIMVEGDESSRLRMAN